MLKTIVKGDVVKFSKSYLLQEPLTEFHLIQGKVIFIGEDDYAEVEFEHLPKTTCRLHINDLELVPIEDMDKLDENTISLEQLEYINNEDIGGMSRAELIKLKIQAQESDPALDRDISAMLE